MFVGVSHTNFVAALYFQPTVIGFGHAQSRRHTAQSQADVSTHRKTLDRFGVSATGFASNLDALFGIQNRQVGVFDFDEETLAGFQFVSVRIVACQSRSDPLECIDRATVVGKLKVPQADVVISLVDFRPRWEFFDHAAHQLKTLSVVSRVIKTNAHFQGRDAALIVVWVFFCSNTLEVHSSAIVGAVAIQKVVTQSHVRHVANFAARIAFNHALPNLNGLIDLFGFVASVAGSEQFFGGAVFDKRSSWPCILRDGRDGAQ